MSKKLYCYSFRDFVDRFEGVETLPEDSVAISICTPPIKLTPFIIKN